MNNYQLAHDNFFKFFNGVRNDLNIPFNEELSPIMDSILMQLLDENLSKSFSDEKMLEDISENIGLIISDNIEKTLSEDYIVIDPLKSIVYDNIYKSINESDIDNLIKNNVKANITVFIESLDALSLFDLALSKGIGIDKMYENVSEGLKLSKNDKAEVKSTEVFNISLISTLLPKIKTLYNRSMNIQRMRIMKADISTLRQYADQKTTEIRAAKKTIDKSIGASQQVGGDNNIRSTRISDIKLSTPEAQQIKNVLDGYVKISNLNKMVATSRYLNKLSNDLNSLAVDNKSNFPKWEELSANKKN